MPVSQPPPQPPPQPLPQPLSQPPSQSPSQPAPRIAAPSAATTAIARLIRIMAHLRGPDGCAWDRAQDFGSIAPYTIEEAYEVVDAIDRGDIPGLQDELGDLLLQVVFHARIAEDAGLFGLADVATAICAKLERRHPHLFAAGAAGQPPLTADQVKTQWEAIKAAEAPRHSALDGVTLGLPALLRARKIADRAARTGFDWPDASGARAKIDEELSELDAETTAESTAERRADEAGDLLFAVVNYLHHLEIEPETALRQAVAKFERRFRHMEADPRFAAADPAAREQLWQAAKSATS